MGMFDKLFERKRPVRGRTVSFNEAELSVLSSLETLDVELRRKFKNAKKELKEMKKSLKSTGIPIDTEVSLDFTKDELKYLIITLGEYHFRTPLLDALQLKISKKLSYFDFWG